MCATEMDFKTLCVARALVNKVAAGRVSLPAGNEQSEVECDTSATRICELEVAGATCNRDLGLFGAGCAVFET